MVVAEMKSIMGNLRKYRGAINTMVCLNINMKLITSNDYLIHNDDGDYSEIENIIDNINNSVKKIKKNVYEFNDDGFNENLVKFKIQIFKVGNMVQIVDFLSRIQKTLKKISYHETQFYNVNDIIYMSGIHILENNIT